ncbi:hypothetical protein Tco_0137446, partial [Tanacetum coccineum]
MVVENIMVVMVVVKNIAVLMIVVKKIVVAYFLDSCNFGSHIVDFDDTPIVSDKLDRGDICVPKGGYGCYEFEFWEPGVDGFDWFEEDEYCCGLELRRWFLAMASDGGVVASAVARPRRLWRAQLVATLPTLRGRSIV